MNRIPGWRANSTAGPANFTASAIASPRARRRKPCWRALRSPQRSDVRCLNPQHAVGPVGLLERRDIADLEDEAERLDRLVQVMGLRCPDDGRSNARPARHPGKRHLGRLDTELARNLLHALGDREILGLEVHALGKIVALGAHGLALLALGHA